MPNRVASVLIAALAAAPVGAQTAGTAPPAGTATNIDSSMDPQAIGAIRVDLQRVDVEATWQKLVAMLQPTPRERESMGRDKDHIAQWVGDFRAAGGQELWLIFTLARLDREPFYVVVPLRPGVKADVLATMLVAKPSERGPGGSRPAGKGGPFSGFKAATLRGAIVAAPPGLMEVLRGSQPVARPEAAAAIAAATPAACQVFWLPTKDMRRVIEETLTELPDELGGGPATVLTRGALWAVASMDGPPQMSLRIVVQSKDDNAAKALGELFPKAIRWAVHRMDLKIDPPQWDQLIRALTPKAVGPRLELALGGPQLDAVISDLLTPSLHKARAQARRALAMNQVRQLVTAVHVYAGDHQGQLPPRFEALARYVGGPEGLARLLVNPRRPGVKVGFVYVRPAALLKDIARTDRTVMVYEAYDQWGDGICVGFVDGHVEFVADEARFKKLLAASTTAAPAP